jgi:hypothetical protein
MVDDARGATRRLDHEEVPFAKICQEAVGHGGFHHGVLATHWRGHTRWVYDCGSWRKAGREALDKRIEDLVHRCQRERDGHLGLLFVSHFDANHVSGLRRLLKAVPGKTDTVVLPYLGFGGVCRLERSGGSRTLPADLIRQVVDPVSWFRNLGVRRVIQVRPGTPPTGGGKTTPMTDLPPPEDVVPHPTGLYL